MIGAPLWRLLYEVMCAAVPNISRGALHFLLQKYVAVQYGPSGLLMFGALSNLVSVTNSLALGGTQNAIVLKVKKNAKPLNRAELQAIVGLTTIAGIAVCVICLLTTSILFAAAPSTWNEFAAWQVLSLAVICFCGYSIGSFVNAHFIGFDRLASLATNGIASVAIAGIVFAVAFFFASPKAILFVAPMVYAVGVGLASLPTAWRFLKQRSTNCRNSAVFEFTHMVPFAAMAAVSATLNPISANFILGLFSRFHGAEVAGNFQALSRLSDLVNIVAGPIISAYIFPRLIGALDSKSQLRRALARASGLTIVVALALFVIASYPEPFVRLLYSEEFAIAPAALVWYLGGEAARTMLTCLGYLTVVAGSFKAYCLFALLYNGLLCFAASLTVPNGNEVLYSIAYAVVNVCICCLLFLWGSERVMQKK